MQELTVGLLGCGNVGSALWHWIGRTQQYITDRDGTRINVRHVLVRDAQKMRGVLPSPQCITADAEKILTDPDVDVIVEVLGGYEPARTCLLEALQRGKHIVTANKVVVARAWDELSQAAAERDLYFGYEAAVGAALPVVAALKGPLAATPLRRVRGIINGTSNYILTRMGQGLAFDEALAEAQRLGYAEPDPADDLDGWDAAYKIAILSALAFDWNLDMSQVQVEGIRHISRADVEAARRAGGAIRLLASGQRDRAGAVQLRVAPVELPADDPLAGVDGVENAVLVEGEPLGSVTFRGAGAGPLPTAAGLLGDLRQLGLQRRRSAAGLTAPLSGGGRRVLGVRPDAY
ncbi:MAG: homoserine dehydrogenase [Thermaerobacterales bacterium]